MGLFEVPRESSRFLSLIRKAIIENGISVSGILFYLTLFYTFTKFQ